MYRNLDFFVKTATIVDVLLVSVLIFFDKNSSYFREKKKIITLKPLAAVILWFLLQLKVILRTFLQKMS